jgi:hypothetical protein
MARVKQFADDLGISKNQAQSLINKGRSRKDGGSQILENVMKPKGYKDGGSKTKKKKDKKNNSKADLIPYIKGGRAEKNYGDSQIIPDIRDGRAKPLDKDIDFADLMIKAGRDNSSIKGYRDGGSKPKKKPNKNYSNDAQSSVVSNKEKLKRIGKDLDRPKDATKGFDMGPDHPYIKALNKAKKESGQEAAEKNKKADGGLPDLTGDGKVTRADVLKGRGVPGFSRGGGMAIQGLGFKGVR